jgi:hypothetical protein
MLLVSEGRVRDIGIKGKDGRELWLKSWCGKKRIVAPCFEFEEVAEEPSFVTGSGESRVVV